MRREDKEKRKMVVAIYAYENNYGGMHGFSSHRVIEVDSLEEAEEIAYQESCEVINNFGCIMEDIETAAEEAEYEEGTDEYNEFIENSIQEDVAFDIWEVIDRYAPVEEMEEDFFNSRSEFVAAHCKELV